MNMFRNQNFNILQKSAIILFVILVSMLIGQFISSILGMIINPELFTEKGFAEASTTAEINVLKLMQFVSATFTFVLPAIIIAFLFSKDVFEFLNLKSSPSVPYYLLTVLFLFSVLPAMNIIIIWNQSLQLPESLSGFEKSLQSMEESGLKMTEIMLAGNGFGSLLINLLLMAVIPAIGEEFLFRGVIQKHLIEWTRKPHLAIIISAIIFSAVHFQFYGFIPRVILGMIFGYLVFYSGSLWPAIFAHFFNNAMAVMAYKYAGDSLGQSEIDTFGTTSSDFYFILIGLVIAYFIGRHLFRKRVER